MPKINVHTPFQFTHADGTKQDFAVGVHEVDKNVADHWFVLPHTGDAPVKSADEKSADELLGELDKREKAIAAQHEALKTAQAEQAKKAAELASREKAAEQRDADLSKREEAVAAREKAAEHAPADAAAAAKAVPSSKK